MVNLMGNDLGLRDEDRAALETIVKCRRAWLAGLAEPIMRRLIEAGFAVLWDRDAHGRLLVGGPYITLTPWGAERLGVELRERHYIRWERHETHSERLFIEELYWARVGIPQRPFVLPPQARQSRLDYPDLVPAPVPGPEYLTDEDGEPILLFRGYKARIDPRLHRH